MRQLTKEQAIILGESEVYKEWNYEQIVRFQLFQDCLCMPFGVFHEAIEKVLNRPVFTHEFAFDGIKKEYLGVKEAPSFEDIISLIPKDKIIIV